MSLNAKDKKILGISGAVLVVVAIIVAVLAVLGGKSYSKEEIQSMPANSLEAIKVEDPEPFHKDKSSDKHINVDMLGQKIEEGKIEVPVPVTKSDNKGKKDKDGKPLPPEVTTEMKQIDAPTAEEMNQVTNFGGLRFKVPSIGVDVSYGMVDEVNGVLRPTNFTAAFGVRNIGVAYDKTQNGTTYVVTHTTDVGGLAPGNYFFNDYYSVANPKIKNGDEITIGKGGEGQKFKVTDHFRRGKAVVMGDEEIWDATIKNRMVIIICAPNSLDNYIIVAEKA